MKIASWNVNSIRARLPRITDWLQSFEPDILLLQETKVTNEEFPCEPLEALNYKLTFHGQKAYNGVAILSKFAIDQEHFGLPGDSEDGQARYVECLTGGIRVASIYLPNGNPAPGDKYDYKLSWMQRLIERTKVLLRKEEPLILGGDYNICPTDEEVYNPEVWVDDALCRPEARNYFRELINLGLTDAFRAFNPGPGKYSYWDYTGGAWQKDFGLLIDHLLLSPEAADGLKKSGIDKKPRGKQKPSDHTPVWCEINLGD